MNIDTARRLDVRKSARLRDCYSGSFLFKELLPAVRNCSHSEFAKFHIDTLNSTVDEFNIWGVTAAIKRFQQNGEFAEFDFHAAHNFPKVGEDIYLSINKYDFVKNISFQQTGKAILNSDIMPLEKWLDTEIYYYMKLPFGIHHSATLMYKLPYKQLYRFKITYFSNMSKTFNPSITPDEIEFLSLPLYLGWLTQVKIIDCQTLRDWYELLVGMTPTRLALLREIVNTGRYQNAAVAARLQVSERVVRNYIADAYGAIAHLLPDPEFALANTSPCVDLVRYYAFLRLAGPSRPTHDPTCTIQ